MRSILIEWRGWERWATTSERDLFACVVGLGPLAVYLSNDRVSQSWARAAAELAECRKRWSAHLAKLREFAGS